MVCTSANFFWSEHDLLLLQMHSDRPASEVVASHTSVPTVSAASIKRDVIQPTYQGHQVGDPNSDGNGHL